MPAFGKLEQKNQEFKAILGYMRPCLRDRQKTRGDFSDIPLVSQLLRSLKQENL